MREIISTWPLYWLDINEPTMALGIAIWLYEASGLTIFKKKLKIPVTAMPNSVSEFLQTISNNTSPGLLMSKRWEAVSK